MRKPRCIVKRLREQFDVGAALAGRMGNENAILTIMVQVNIIRTESLGDTADHRLRRELDRRLREQSQRLATLMSDIGGRTANTTTVNGFRSRRIRLHILFAHNAPHLPPICRALQIRVRTPIIAMSHWPCRPEQPVYVLALCFHNALRTILLSSRPTRLRAGQTARHTLSFSFQRTCP